ncbi:UNVERIFIED_CONTAM: hypothetical protein FKN15_052886 [Acipenser sinensis]
MPLPGSLPDVKKKRYHITLRLAQQHWLPVKLRIIFKTLLLTYNALHHTGPEYLLNLLTCYVPACKLRSFDWPAVIPKQKCTTLGELSFSFMAQTLWNSVPDLEKKRHGPVLRLFDDVGQGPTLDRKGKIAMSDQVQKG